MLNRVQACASQLPLRTASATLLISRLFPIAYAAAEKPSAKLPQLAREIRRVLHPAGEVAIEIPLSHTPRRLQGISETTEIAPNLIYEFQYLELMCEHELGAVLDTQITVTSSPVTFRLSAPLFVFTPAGALRWACEARLINARFYSSYDLTESTITPPPDALRGILAGTHA